jgi:hypothetical protein
MFVSVYSASLLSCMQVAALRQADPSSKESYRSCKKIKKLKKRPRPNKGAVEPQVDRQIGKQVHRCTDR